MRKINWIRVGSCIPWVVVGFILMVIALSMVEGVLVVNEVIGMNAVKSVQQYIIAVMTFVCCYIAANKTTHGKLIASVIIGTVIFLILMLIKMVFCPNEIVEIGVCGIAILVPVVLAGLLTVRKKTKR